MNNRNLLINHINEVAGRSNIVDDEAEERAIKKFIKVINKRK